MSLINQAVMPFQWSWAFDESPREDSTSTQLGHSIAGASMVMEHDVEALRKLHYIFGSAGIIPAGPFGQYPRLTRSMPLRHPFYPWLFADSIESVVGSGFQYKAGFGYDSGAAIYGRYRSTIRFAGRNYRVEIDDSIAQQEDYRFVEVRTYPEDGLVASDRAQFKFQHNQQPVRASLGVKLYRSRIDMIWHQVPAKFVETHALGNIPTGVFPHFNECQGRVNEVPFYFGLYPSETMLLLGATFEPESSGQPPNNSEVNIPFGERSILYKITYHFLYQEAPAPNGEIGGHNHYPDPADLNGLWYRIETVEGNRPPYQSADFTLLFKGLP